MTMNFNPSIDKINDLFAFRKQYKMENDSIIDVIQEYCFKNDIDDLELFVSDMAEVEGFVEMVRKDAIKHKFMKNDNVMNSNKILSEWEL